MEKNLGHVVKTVKADTFAIICRIRIGAVFKGMVSFNQNLFMERNGRGRTSQGPYVRPPSCRHL